MNSRQQELQEHLSGAPGQQAFIEWLESPMTQLVLAAARERAMPRVVVTGQCTASEAAIAGLYRSLGANDVLDFMASPTRSPVGQPVGVGAGDYGAKEIVRGYGYSGPVQEEK